MSKDFDSIRDRLTPEFLSILVECAKHTGWTVDYHEVREFVELVHGEAGVDIVGLDLEPYETEE